MTVPTELVDRLRAETPMVPGGLVHLNNAGASPMPRRVLESVRDYLDFESEVGGYEAADLRAAEIAGAYDRVADLIGAAAVNIAVVENATVAVAQALSAFDFEPGDVILTSRCDYVSNQLMYLSLARRLGVLVVHAHDLPEGGVDADSVRALIESRQPRLVSLTHVPTNSGLVQDVEAVGAICRELDVPFLVDACQSIGQIELDVARIGCDFLAASARKFLRGPRGIGFLYVGDKALAGGLAPLYVDLHGATWTGDSEYTLSPSARRFENWEFNYANVIGMGAAAEYAAKCGVAQLSARATALAARARERLASIESVRVLDRGGRLCAIVSLTIDLAGADQVNWVERLRSRRINTSSIDRSSAVLDLDAMGVSWGLRVSPHAFNTEDEVDQFVSVLEELIAELG